MVGRFWETTNLKATDVRRRVTDTDRRSPVSDGGTANDENVSTMIKN